MSLKLSAKQIRRYNARQLKKWQAKNRAFIATKNRLRQSLSSMIAAQSKESVQIKLDGIKTVEDFYQRLVAAVTLPEHSAVNLDALYDVLTGDVTESVEFLWANASKDVAQNPEELKGLKSMLDALPQARADISINYMDYSN